MEESILGSIKKLLGIHEDDTTFDMDVMIHINSAILALTENGIGPQNGFAIKGSTEKWSDFLGSSSLLEASKTFIYLTVKLVFDPPTSSFVIDAYQKQLNEIIWRLNIIEDDNPFDDPPSEGEYYEGEYVITPKTYEQTMETKDLLMKDDVEIEEIPLYQVSNTQGGKTAIIGGD